MSRFNFNYKPDKDYGGTGLPINLGLVLSLHVAPWVVTRPDNTHHLVQ